MFMKNRKRKLIIGVGICFTISVIITFIVCILFTPKIVLEEPDLTIEVVEDYKEPGYRAYSNNQDITNRVKVTGKVNSKKLGTYIIAYEVNSFLFHTKKVRIVEVVDKEAPSLELVGDMEVFVCPNDTYQESGYRAIDNYDQDLTAKVLIEDSKEMIDSKKERIYEVVDSSGNKTVKKRIIHYEDLEKPSIILKGNALEYVELYGVYQELGYQAIDRCDGDITSKVVKLFSKMAQSNITIQVDQKETAKLKTTEWRIIALVGSGLSNKEIAARLNLSEGTVRNNLSNILSKLDLRDRTQLAIWAVQTGTVNRTLEGEW